MKRFVFLAIIVLKVIYVRANPFQLKQGLDCDTIGNTYLLTFKMPEFTIETDTLPGLLGDGYFSRLEPESPDEFDYLEVDGRPVLPFYSTNLMLPSDVINVGVTDFQILDSIIIHLPYDYTPAQQRFDFSNGYSYDGDYYGYFDNTWYWQYYTLDKFDYRNYKGLTFSLFPCRYEPLSNSLIVITNAIYEIAYEGTCISDYIHHDLDEHDRLAYNFFDNFGGYPFPIIPPIENDEYLIITADEWVNSLDLADFVDHKTSLGYHVTLTPLHDIGYTPESIRSYIRQQYLEHQTKYVLLIGEVGDVTIDKKLPFCDGQPATMSDPPSDLYYSCLSQDNIANQWVDFTPTVFVGRWPIQNADQLTNVIKKTKMSDLYLGHYNPGKISLFSGKDNSLCSYYMQSYFYGDCYYIDKNIIQPYTYYTGGILNGGDGASLDMMIDSLENSNAPIWMFVYDGHGNTDAIGSPYHLTNTSITSIITSDLNFQPFGVGFACLLGDSYQVNNFARSWVTSTQGGVSFLGSTTNTTVICDKYFSRKLFNQLKNHPPMTIGEFVANGKANYYNPDKVIWRRREAKRYVLYGDPSLYLFGLDIDYDARPLYANKQLENEINDKIQLIVKDNILQINVPNIESVYVYSITGQLLLTDYTNQISIQNLPSGIYTAIVNAENTQISTKIVKL